MMGDEISEIWGNLFILRHTMLIEQLPDASVVNKQAHSEIQRDEIEEKIECKSIEQEST